VRLITYNELKPLKGIPFSREHLRRLEAEGNSLSASAWRKCGDYYGYVEKEIDEYLAARAAARDCGRAA
jgi:hypothetical protein